MKPATCYVHAGQDPDPATGALTVPISLSTTFEQDGVGSPRGGWEYSRTANPSRKSLELAIAASEGGSYGLCFASGSAATCAVLNLLEPGDGVVSAMDLYGGTWRLLKRVYERYGVDVRFLDTQHPDEYARAITERTRIVWVESPTNPLLNIVDVSAVAATKGARAILVVDNTFASPYFQNPLALGADIVVHSTTKYIGGHSDVVGGAIVTNREDLAQELAFYQNAVGAVPSPFDCYLTQRGLRTLAVRMERHAVNARAVASVLESHSRIRALYYPGLAGHPGHEVAARQMTGFSGMVSFDLVGGRPAVERFVSRLEIFRYAESLGAVESLACHPATMTHGAIPEEDRRRIGITDGLVRLSVGIEDAEDLTHDLFRALE